MSCVDIACAGVLLGLVFLYIAGDIGYLAKGLHDNNVEPSVATRTISHAVVFHGIASLAVPSLVIHTAVKQSYVLAHYLITGVLFSVLSSPPVPILHTVL